MRQLARFYLSHGAHLQDVMIASVAARLAVPLYTLNVKHYEPLPGLRVVRPYSRNPAFHDIDVPEEDVYSLEDGNPFRDQ